MGEIKRCPRGNKICHNTRKKAIKAAQRGLTQSIKTGQNPARNIYQCPYCGDWHLTKEMPRDTEKKGSR